MRLLRHPYIITTFICLIASFMLALITIPKSFNVAPELYSEHESVTAMLIAGTIILCILLSLPANLVVFLIYRRMLVKVFFLKLPFVFTLTALIAFFLLPFTYKPIHHFLVYEFGLEDLSDPESLLLFALALYWFFITIVFMALFLYFQLSIYKQTVSEVLMEKRGKTKEDIKFIIASYFNIICIYSLIYLTVQIWMQNKAFSGLEIILDSNSSTFESMLSCLYFSFTTISSLGYDVFPEAWYAKGLVVSQFIFGMLLMVFSLGVILSKEDEPKYKNTNNYKDIWRRNQRRRRNPKFRHY